MVKFKLKNTGLVLKTPVAVNRFLRDAHIETRRGAYDQFELPKGYRFDVVNGRPRVVRGLVLPKNPNRAPVGSRGASVDYDYAAHLARMTIQNSDTVRISQTYSDWGGVTMTSKVEPRGAIDLLNFPKSAQETVLRSLQEHLRLQHRFKLQLVFHGMYRTQEGSLDDKPTETGQYTIRTGGDIIAAYEHAMEILPLKVDAMETKGTGWVLQRCISLLIKASKLPQIRGGAFIELPKKIAGKNAVINIKNPDNRCLLWCIIYHFYYQTRLKTNPQDFTVKYANLLEEMNVDLTGLEFPTQPSDIPAFERRFNIGIEVFYLDGDHPALMQRATVRSENPLRVLLLTSNAPGAVASAVQDQLLYGLDRLGDHEAGCLDGSTLSTHYVYVKSWNKLFGKAGRRAVHTCPECYHAFHSAQALRNHSSKGHSTHDGVQEVLPTAEDRTKDDYEPVRDQSRAAFKDFSAKFPVPYTYFCDFEAVLLPPGEDGPGGDCTKVLHVHEPAAQSFLGHCWNGEELWQRRVSEAILMAEEEREKEDNVPPAEDLELLQRPLHTQVGGTCIIEAFVDKLIRHAQAVTYILKKDFGHEWTEEQRDLYESATVCNICERQLSEPSPYSLPKNLQKDGTDLEETEEDSPVERAAKQMLHREYSRIGKKKVAGHDHLTGKHRGAAHCACNLNPGMGTRRPILPVYFHNLEGYDAHLLLEKLGQAAGKLGHRLECIPVTSEKYLSFDLRLTTCTIRFLDSLNMMSGGLDVLANNLTAGGDPLRHLHNTVREGRKLGYGEEQLLLLARKGVFPYEWFDSMEKLGEISLPPRIDFYSKLSCKGVSVKEYEHALLVWETFGCRTFADYIRLYLETDVLLLADVFTAFRKMSMEAYQLDPAHFHTAPGLAWKASQKVTGQVLDLITDVDMYNVVEKAKRGGVSTPALRYAKANNPYLDQKLRWAWRQSAGPGVPEPEDFVEWAVKHCEGLSAEEREGLQFDPSRRIVYLIYWDRTNLYGEAMSQKLPTGDFRWEFRSCEKKTRLATLERTLRGWDSQGERGLFVECDLAYPDALHDAHNFFPLAPESVCVQPEDLSPWSRNARTELGMPNVMTGRKLVPNLRAKKGYVLTIRELQYYLLMGLELTAVHEVVSFAQSAWLEPFITFNTDRRKAARNDFEKAFWKLMNNSIWGKTMENVRGRMRFELVTSAKHFMRLAAWPNYKHFIPFGPGLCGVEMGKVRVILNKPAYVGAAVLSYSKLAMFDFYYGWVQPAFGVENVRMVTTDTDILNLEIACRDVYAVMKRHGDRFDLSEIPKVYSDTGETHDMAWLHDPVNKKKLGTMTCETLGNVIAEVIALRSKMYAMRLAQDRADYLGGGSKRGLYKLTAKGCNNKVVGLGEMSDADWEARLPELEAEGRDPDASARRELTYADYKACLFSEELDDKRQRLTSVSLRSFRHKVYTLQVSKTGVCVYDDKRFYLDNGVDSWAHGHWRARAVLEKLDE